MPPGHNGIVRVEFLTPGHARIVRAGEEQSENVGPACGTGARNPRVRVSAIPECRPVKISTFRPLLIRRARFDRHH